jgi:hypothetical protein
VFHIENVIGIGRVPGEHQAARVPHEIKGRRWEGVP